MSAAERNLDGDTRGASTYNSSWYPFVCICTRVDVSIDAGTLAVWTTISPTHDQLPGEARMRWQLLSSLLGSFVLVTHRTACRPRLLPPQGILRAQPTDAIAAVHVPTPWSYWSSCCTTPFSCPQYCCSRNTILLLCSNTPHLSRCITFCRYNKHAGTSTM